tara:strand:- start:513 stop:647 length:135 start_codon:yes stop_codon:yes gene_type:complete
MPFKIVKVNNQYRLFNLDKKKYTKKKFKTKKSALAMSKVYSKFK